jgi:tyrosyl-tRNA synthetase
LKRSLLIAPHHAPARERAEDAVRASLTVNDCLATDERAVLTLKDLNADGVIKLSLGKKRHVLLRPAP